MNKNFYGERLHQLRIINNMALNDLGDKIGTSKQYVYQLETNVQKPNDLLVACLSQVLHVLPSFFTRSYDNRVEEGQCYFRKAKTTPDGEKEKVRHCAALLEDYVHFIETEFDLPPINFDGKEAQSNEEIEKAADAARMHWGLGLDRPIDDMSRTLENAGAIITYFKSLSDKVDAFSINRVRPIVIRNPAKDNACRQRFDLAHECGHLILHKFNEFIPEDELKEEQANRFASAFLLPRVGFMQEFYPAFQGYRINWSLLLKLKKRWKVSFGAMIRRAYDLDIIDPLKYRSAYVYLRKTGQIKTEIGDEDIPLETATLLPSITKELLDNYRNNLTQFIIDRGMSFSLLSEATAYPFSSVLDEELRSFIGN